MAERAIVTFAGALALALAPLPAGTLERAGAAAGRLSREERAALPLAAQGAISRVLGRDDPSYHTRRSGSGFTAENRRHGLEARFVSEGVQVRSGNARLGLALRAWGYGETLRPLAPAAPHARANRVEYRRGPLSEWYVNGPGGLQQGFTLAAPPATRPDGPLTLALSLSGTVQPRLEPGRDELALGGCSLRYRGLLAFDATGRELPARLELRSRTLLLRVEDESARYPLTIDPFVQQAKLTASDGAANDFLGRSVAVSGDTVVVGADGDDIGANDDQGSAYVFVKPASGWVDATETAKLTALDGAAFDRFGASVGVSGDTIVVGAYTGDVGVNTDQGSAYVFVKPAGGWVDATQTAKLTASDGAANDQFGTSVAVSGDTIVVGAVGDNIGANAEQGSAYVFVKPAAGWADATETAKLTASDGAANDFFGRSVGVSADTAVVGADFHDVGANVNQGAAYVFVKPAGGWADTTETAKLSSSDGVANDRFGFSVAVSGDTAVVGALNGGTPLCGIACQGSAYVFVKPAGGWVDAFQTAELLASDGQPGDQFGFSVAVSGDAVVVGAQADDVGINPDQGSAYLFLKPAGGWMDAFQTAKLTASDGAASDFFGNSVAASGDTVVVGAVGDDVGVNPQQGSAYVFVDVPEIVPEISIDDVAVAEGDAGTTPAVFTVTLSTPSSAAVTVNFGTANGTATIADDYIPAFGTLVFEPGETSKTVTVFVVGDTLDEPDETFFVNLSLPMNAVIADGQGVGTILNDEPPPPPGAEHDVGVAGGGFRTKGHIDISRNGAGPFEVKIKVKNFGQVSEDIFYSVSSSELFTFFSPACFGLVLDVPPNTAVSVSGCTVTYAGGAADPDPVLTLTVTHNDGDGGTDSNPANNSDSQGIVINP